MLPQEPVFFSPLRILTFVIVIFLTFYIGFTNYRYEGGDVFTYTHIYYAFGFLILVFGILKCLFHLARVELKALLFTALATAIYLGIVFTGNTVCDKIKEHHKSEQFQTKVYEKK